MLEVGVPVKQAVILLADGARPDIMQDLVSRGELPEISEVFQLGAGGKVGLAASVFPSTTGPAHLPFLTGLFPGACNVPGIRWFDPARYAKGPLSLHRFRSYMGLGGLLLDSDIRSEVKTIFEYVADHASIANLITRGVRPGRNLTRFDKPIYNIKSFLSEEWAAFDRLAARRLLEAVRRRRQLVYAVLYEVDSHAHKFGPADPRTIDAYRRLDGVVGELRRVLVEDGRTASTLVALVSDHGASDTQRHLDLAGVVESVVGTCLAHPLIWHGLLAAKAAVMVSGNAMAHVYLRGPGGWAERSLLDAPSEDLTRLVAALLELDAVELLAGRTSDGGVLVVSRRGRARISPRAEPLRYEFEGEDPLQGATSSPDSHYPDAVAQLSQIMTSPRTGDLAVCAALGWDLRARFEKPAHLGSHGSLHRLHMSTPFLINAELKSGPWRTVDLMPTVLEALGQSVPPGLDGRSLWVR